MPRRKNGFRLNRKCVGLTYSCPTPGPNPIGGNEELREFFATLCTSFDYIIGRETHPSNGEIHYHAYLKSCVAFETSNSRYFDFKGVHPNILPGSPGAGWLAYCCKDKEFITNFYQKSAWSEALALPSAAAALEHLWQREPKTMLLQGHQVELNMVKRFKVEYVHAQYTGPYPVCFYPRVWDMSRHSLLILGPPGIGKTQFARYLLGDCDYIKGTYETGLKMISFTKPIVFDEINMLHRDPELSKELTDVENGGTIPCRYKDVIIPPGVPRIFVNNFRCFRDPHNAVYGRRLQVLDLFPERRTASPDSIYEQFADP